MKILITGGAGFIGKYLTKYLIENKNEVTIFDNFSNSSKNEMKKELDGVPFIEGDIRNLEEILKHLKNYDMVIHLAAKISVTDSIKNPKETFDVNVEGTKNILKACDKNDVKKLLVLSSAAVYGNNLILVKTFSENEITNPISPYEKVN